MKCQLFLQFAEGDHATVDLVPKSKLDGLEAVEEPEFRGILEEGVRMVAALQVVIGNTWVEVVDVVVADVSGEPLKDSRKVVVAASSHGGGRVVPVVTGGPVRVLELVLDVEQPETEKRSNGHHGQLDNEPRKESKDHAHADAPDDQRGVHGVHGLSLSTFRFGV